MYQSLMIDALIKIKDLEKVYLTYLNLITLASLGGEPRIFWLSYLFFL